MVMTRRVRVSIIDDERKKEEDFLCTMLGIGDSNAEEKDKVRRRSRGRGRGRGRGSVKPQ